MKIGTRQLPFKRTAYAKCVTPANAADSHPWLLFCVLSLSVFSSWDEWFPFNSTRLAPAGTHTTSADVEKHTEKAVTGTLCGSVDVTTNGGAASSVSASPLSVDDFTQPFHSQSSAGAAGGSAGPAAAAAAASPLKGTAGTLSGTKRKKVMVTQ
jgi:hypothetical protein